MICSYLRNFKLTDHRSQTTDRHPMSWFKKTNKPRSPHPDEERTVRTEGLFIKCPACEQMLFKREVEDNLNVCTKCGHHRRINAVARLKMTFDDEQWVEFDSHLASNDPLHFVDTKSYVERLEDNESSTGLPDAIISAEGKLGGHTAIVCAMELSFVGGSLGSVVGEKITRAIERAIQTQSSLIVYSASGG